MLLCYVNLIPFTQSNTLHTSTGLLYHSVTVPVQVLYMHHQHTRLHRPALQSWCARKVQTPPRRIVPERACPNVQPFRYLPRVFYVVSTPGRYRNLHPFPAVFIFRSKETTTFSFWSSSFLSFTDHKR